MMHPLTICARRRLSPVRPPDPPGSAKSGARAAARFRESPGRRNACRFQNSPATEACRCQGTNYSATGEVLPPALRLAMATASGELGLESAKACIWSASASISQTFIPCSLRNRLEHRSSWTPAAGADGVVGKLDVVPASPIAGAAGGVSAEDEEALTSASAGQPAWLSPLQEASGDVLLTTWMAFDLLGAPRKPSSRSAPEVSFRYPEECGHPKRLHRH